jgi:MoxR-like ATPase
LQKDQLKQDVFLIGPPGPERRRLAFKYCELTQREIEYVSISKDTTSSDLKQRREIKNRTAYYIDQSAVNAAVHGRILVLDGIEKSERNVLPVINNLLENREMALEDGRFLVAPDRYDALLKTHSLAELKRLKLVRVSERFRVMALGLPVPTYMGNPLDPPLRSRFQCRDISSMSVNAQIDQLKEEIPDMSEGHEKLYRNLIQAREVMKDVRIEHEQMAVLPEFAAAVKGVGKMLQTFPEVEPRFMADCLYPFPQIPFVAVSEELRDIVTAVYGKFGLATQAEKDNSQSYQDIMSRGQHESGYDIVGFPEMELVATGICQAPGAPSWPYFEANLTMKVKSGGVQTIRVPAGNATSRAAQAPPYTLTAYQSQVINALVHAHSSGDICLVGGKGVGKSVVLDYFAWLLGYSVERVQCYKDMSARDLLMNRTTDEKGNTTWRLSPLVTAALMGQMCVLDGIEQLGGGTLSTLQALMSDREIVLPDGRKLLGHDKYQELSEQTDLSFGQLRQRNVFPIHPSFRLVAVGKPAASAEGQTKLSYHWLTPEVNTMFLFVWVRNLDQTEESQVLSAVCPDIAGTPVLDQLLAFSADIRSSSDDVVMSLANQLSTRQMIRICRRVSRYETEELGDAIHRACLSRFVPSLVKDVLVQLLGNHGIKTSSSAVYDPQGLSDYDVVDVQFKEVPNRKDVPEGGVVGELSIGQVSTPVLSTPFPQLVPKTLFYHNPRQDLELREMLKDHLLNDPLLLIGNQGVGKNKLIDRLLDLLNTPREYIQLHRDTTVQQLTSQPVVVDGILKFEDSPLVEAAKNGYVLVVDEADKAPTHVTAVLKSLVEDGEMLLADGRRIISPQRMMERGNFLPPESICCKLNSPPSHYQNPSVIN